MQYGLISGILWAIDTVILGVALGMTPYLDAPQASIVSACVHDVFAALILLIFMGARGRLRDTVSALKTRSGKVVVLGALLGGPIGMSGYLAAINNIGPGYTAAISAFYPAVGSALAWLLLKERMKLKQVLALLVALVGVMLMGLTSADAVTGNGNVAVGILGVCACVFGWGSEAVILAWGMQDSAVDNETALQIRETTSALAYGIVVVPLTGSFGFAVQTAVTPANGIVLLAALAGTVSYLFYYKAIDAIGASRGMALNISYSAWAVIFAALAGVLLPAIMPEAIPSPLAALCCIVIIVGTVLSATPDWRELGIKREFSGREA